MDIRVLVACVLLTGCVSSSTGTNISSKDWDSLVVGKTTKVEAVQLFGHPLVSANNEMSVGTGDWALCGEKGTSVETLIYTAQNVTATPFSASSSSSHVSLRFNKQGVLCLKTRTEV